MDSCSVRASNFRRPVRIGRNRGSRPASNNVTASTNPEPEVERAPVFDRAGCQVAGVRAAAWVKAAAGVKVEADDVVAEVEE